MEPDEIEVYYNRGKEQERLQNEVGKLEEARTRELILRSLPEPPAEVLDIGGGAGVYALWLAELGYRVHLVDKVGLHVEQARAASERQGAHSLASVRVGDARQIEFADESAAVVLLLGPLYHLPEREDRVSALREAHRVLQPGGVLFAAGISRFASLLDGLFRGYLADERFAGLVEQDLQDGQHRNPGNVPGYFTTAFFHTPEELAGELSEAGFRMEGVLAVEGPAGFMPDFERFWNEPALRERLLRVLRMVEADPALRAATGHLLAIGRK